MATQTSLIDFNQLWAPPQLDSLDSFSDDLIKQFETKHTLIQTDFEAAIKQAAVCQDPVAPEADESREPSTANEDIAESQLGLPCQDTLSVDSAQGAEHEAREDDAEEVEETATSASVQSEGQEPIDADETDEDEDEDEGEADTDTEPVEEFAVDHEQVVNTSTTTAVTTATTATAVTQIRVDETEDEPEDPAKTVVPSVAGSEETEPADSRRPHKGLLRKSSAFLRQKVLKRQSKDMPITPPLPVTTTAHPSSIRQFPPKPLQYGTVDPPSDALYRTSMPPVQKPQPSQEEEPVRRQSEPQVTKPKRRSFFAFFSRGAQ